MRHPLRPPSRRPVRRTEMLVAMQRAEDTLRALASELSLPGWARYQIIRVANGLSKLIQRAEAQRPTPP